MNLFRCNGVPRECLTDGEGEILCNKCAEQVEDASPSKGLQRMILKLKTRCMSIIGDKDDDNDEGSGNIIATRVRDNECDWTGMIQDHDQHTKECGYIIINCDKCNNYECQRQLMPQHDNECPQAQIPCPLSCGMFIYNISYLRYDYVQII